MPATRHHAPVEPSSTPGLMLSLVSALPDPSCPLARRARSIAHRLADGRSDRALRRRAADIMAAMLDAADAGLALDDDGLLDGGFDD